MRDGARDFDFLCGTWRRHDRRLRVGASGAKEWEEFDGFSSVRPLWDGRANLEDYRADAPGGPLHAVRLHLYDPRSRQWNLSWANRTDGTLGPAAVGEFRDGRGEFFSFEDVGGRMGLLRLTWTNEGRRDAGFAQAVSTDGGRTWETNWVMRFERLDDGTSPPVSEWPTNEAPDDGVRGFDFLHGAWRIHNRRLCRPLSGSAEWYAFEGRSVERPFWDGEGNLSEYEGDAPDGPIRGLALRLYDPRSRQWSIHWSNSRFGVRDRPLVGGFRDGRGEFYAQDVFEGREVLLRFLWTSEGAGAARWEQAFSDDGARTWETNWTMDFARVR